MEDSIAMVIAIVWELRRLRAMEIVMEKTMDGESYGHSVRSQAHRLT